MLNNLLKPEADKSTTSMHLDEEIYALEMTQHKRERKLTLF